MGQRADPVEAEESGRALDRVHGSEDGVHEIGIDGGPVGLNRQHLVLDVGEPLLGLDDEFGHQFLISYFHDFRSRRGAASI